MKPGKSMAAVLLAAVTLTPLVAGSAEAQFRERRWDRIEDDRYYRSDYDRRGNWGGRRDEMVQRAARIRNRADNLYRQGRLSREHRDRVYEKLERIRDDVRGRGRVDSRRVEANERWMDSVERDLENWSRSDSRIFRRRR